MGCCDTKDERLTRLEGHAVLNGIAAIEVADLKPGDLTPAELSRYEALPEARRGQLLWQRRLKVFFVNPLQNSHIEALKDGLILVQGGVRIRGIMVEQIKPDPGTSRLLLLKVSQAGDFSLYTLKLTRGPDSTEAPENFDPIFAVQDFSFKAACPSDFDCQAREIPTAPALDEPGIDYLAKDYASLRRLMLDRLGFLLPDWKERNPADLGIALVELLASVGDYLSYYQDAVATESYLGTARKRVSLKRHARLLDYPMHEGCNARTWVQIQIKPGADPLVLPGPRPEALLPGMALTTRIDHDKAVVSLDQPRLEAALADGAQVFETLHPIALYEAHNRMEFYTWGDAACCLEQGATRAFLKDDQDGKRLLLMRGDVLIFEQVRSPATGLTADADPAKRHAVRLTAVRPEASIDTSGQRRPGTPLTDPLFPDQAYVEISWASEDAQPFCLPIHQIEDPDIPGRAVPVSVASGNVVLADQGLSITEALTCTKEKRYRPSLKDGPITQQGHQYQENKAHKPLVPFDPGAPASRAFTWEMCHVMPAIRLRQDNNQSLTWLPQRDLLASDAFAREFVVEVEDDARARLRFGDDVLGLSPVAGTPFTAAYRIGNGAAGNVGAESIVHVLVRSDLAPITPSDLNAVKLVRNPLAARGGIRPETGAQVRAYAPQAFKRQERAVNAPDYATIAMRHPLIQKAAATVRWTGSWYTVYVTIDRKDGKAVDAAFIQEMKAYLDCYRMAGYDIEISAPRYIPLDIAATVCVKPGYYDADVKEVLLETLSNRDLAGGQRGFFHPDNFTFGQAVYLSRVYAAAMAVEGVSSIDVHRFQRWGKKANQELEQGLINVGRLEVVRLDNDPNFPENGKLNFTMRPSHE